MRLCFSGDVGRLNLPIIPDPKPCPNADYLIMESTYGDRLHKDLGQVADKFADAVVRTAGRGGKHHRSGFRSRAHATTHPVAAPIGESRTGFR